MSIPRPERETIIEALRRGEWPVFVGKHDAPICVPIDRINFKLEYGHGFEDLQVMGVSQAKLDEPNERKPGLNVLILALPIDFPIANPMAIPSDFDENFHHAVLLRKPYTNELSIDPNHLVIESLVAKSVNGLKMFVHRHNPLIVESFAVLA